FDRINKNFGGVWFASVLDRPSYESLKQYDVPFMKLPSTISRHKDFISDVAGDWDGNLVMSLGMTDLEDYEFIVGTLYNHATERPGRRENYMLQCTSAYPASLNELNLGLLNNGAWRHEDVG